MLITPYKNREIDYNKPVYVYRNLNSSGVNYSVKQLGLVVAHAETLMLTNVEFIIHKSGKERCMKERVRNVHAFVKGLISQEGRCGLYLDRLKGAERPLGVKVKYNPFTNEGFHSESHTDFTLKEALCVVFNDKGVWATATVGER